MTDDIVTRLRRKFVMETLGDKNIYLTFGDCIKAADEIERLRNKLEQFHKILDIYNETCKCDGCAACCQYELVVRDKSTN